MKKQSFIVKVKNNMWSVYVLIAVLEFFVIGGGLGALFVIPALAAFALRKIEKKNPDSSFRWVVIALLAVLALAGVLSKVFGFTFLF